MLVFLTLSVSPLQNLFHLFPKLPVQAHAKHVCRYGFGHFAGIVKQHFPLIPHFFRIQINPILPKDFRGRSGNKRRCVSLPYGLDLIVLGLFQKEYGG
jgi:hypothetical protein